MGAEHALAPDLRRARIRSGESTLSGFWFAAVVAGQPMRDHEPQRGDLWIYGDRALDAYRREMSWPTPSSAPPPQRTGAVAAANRGSASRRLDELREIRRTRIDGM